MTTPVRCCPVCGMDVELTLLCKKEHSMLVDGIFPMRTELIQYDWVCPICDAKYVSYEHSKFNRRVSDAE